ncbi:MAG: 1,2-phenylacetyl-CoA epoxidase subunit PaaE [Bacteroidota bacterium]
MAKFYTLNVATLTRPTTESVAITLEIPDELMEAFVFIQGQHITLKKEIDGEDIRRSYSICSCPMDKTITVAIKKLEGGKFSTYANDVLRAGEELEVMPPHGKFYVPLDPENANSYVAFASGSGITPIISIIETTLRIEPESEFTLFYGNRGSNTIIFQEELEALKNRYMNRFSLYHILSKERQESELFNGRIDGDKIKSFAQLFFNAQSINHYFTCGPEEMMLKVKDSLLDMGVPEKRIHYELFTSPIAKLGSENRETQHKKALAEITVVLDGNSLTFPYNSDKSILDVAFDNGADLPYACKGGVCSTCRCKVEEGNVEMNVNYALEPDEIEKGLILSCQAFPKTDKVKLNFDV